MKITFAEKSVDLEINGVVKRAPTHGAITESAYSPYGKGPVGHNPVYVAYRVFGCIMGDDDAYRLAYQIGPVLFGQWVTVPATFDLEAVAGDIHARFNVVKRQRINLANPAQRLAGCEVSVARFLELDGMYASLAEWGIEGLLHGRNSLPESTMPADKVEAALLLLHHHPAKIPTNPHPYLKRMLERMSVHERWDALAKTN